MEEEVHVNRYAPTLLGHFLAAVNLDTRFLDIFAMVCKFVFIFYFSDFMFQSFE